MPLFVDNYFLYLLVAIGYIASPGPAVFLAINGGATAGVKTTATTLLGNTIGLGVIALISALGIGILILNSPVALQFVKVAGACWLAYLGVKMITTSKSDVIRVGSDAQKNIPNNPLVQFGSGMVLALTNPKPIVFFVSIYPQFIVVNGQESAQLVVLGVTFMVLSYLLLNLYALLSSKTIGKVLSPRRMQIFNWGFGATFIVLAVSLLFPAIANAGNHQGNFNRAVSA